MKETVFVQLPPPGSVPAMHVCSVCGTHADPKDGDAMHVCMPDPVDDTKTVKTTAKVAADAAEEKLAAMPAGPPAEALPVLDG